MRNLQEDEGGDIIQHTEDNPSRYWELLELIRFNLDERRSFEDPGSRD